MDSLPLHPRIVHIPIALSVLMPLLATGLLVAWWREWLPKRAWIIALLMQATLVGASYVALETGEGDEERVERVVASEAGLEAHEEAAEVFFMATIAGLVLFAAGAFLRKERAARAAASVAVLSTLAVAALGYRVGHAGGELVYRDGAASAYTSPKAAAQSKPTAGEQASNDEDSDDD